MSNFSNKHIKMVVNESKQESDNALKMQVEKNKKDIIWFIGNEKLNS